MSRQRHLDITDRSVAIDGVDISNMVTRVDIRVDAVEPPSATIHIIPDVLTYEGDPVVWGLPPDGISRLRRWLQKRSQAS